MPRIKADKAYGVGPQDQRLMFREKLMKRFAAHDFVRVINVDNEPFIWQYLPSSAEDFEFTPDPMKITHRGEVEMYRLDPGQSEVIVGENAYLMIEGLYKKLSAKKMIGGRPDLGPGQARNFNWTDGYAQDEWINKIYLGKESPHFNAAGSTQKKINSIKEQVSKDLGLVNVPKKKAPIAPAGRLRQS